MSSHPSLLVNHPARVSFTVRRPSPHSSRQSSAGPETNPPTPSNGFRIPPPPHLPKEAVVASSPLRHDFDDEEAQQDANDSSDEDDVIADELVSGFDSMGVQRVKPTAKATGPLVIAPLANRDWRAIARSRQAAKGYIPDNARGAAVTGPDGSQGGLGTKDSINSGPQLVGLIVKDRPANVNSHIASPQTIKSEPESEDTEMRDPVEPLDEDARALQALLRGPSIEETQPELAAIPLDEEAALKRDLADLPDVASLDDYARVPVSQFGAAMLRGMGWKPPSAKGDGEPWVPSQRPALLGLGAKPRAEEVNKSGSGGKVKPPSWMTKAKERRYVPLMKKEKEGSTSLAITDGHGSGSARTSRASSRSRSPPARDASRRSDRDRDGGGRDSRERDRGERGGDRDYRKERDDKSRRDEPRERSSRIDRESDRERVRDRGSGRDRDYNSRERRR